MTAPGRDTAMPTLAYAILALLAREPLTGYEMSRLLRDPIGLFWQARHSQIYPTLSRLEQAGWTTSQQAPGPGPRPTSRHAITDIGLDALRRWVASPPGRRSSRDELLLRVYASWVVDAPTIIAILREAEARHAKQLREYLSRRDRTVATGGPGPARSAGFADYATLRRGIGFERGRLAWVRWLIQQIEDDPEQDTGRR
jgi:DNA-binding PadR family transcriptional regulator